MDCVGMSRARPLSALLLAPVLACSGPGTDGGDPDAGTPPPADGGTVVNGIQATTSVRIIVEPSDNAGALVAAINSAQSSVHMTMYLLSSSTVVNALTAKRRAGKEVKVLL